jgi:uncharacterized surface protein with fasciclin (FAS1) repeats
MDTTVVVETPNIEVAAGKMKIFSTLVAAVKAANLVETLSSEDLPYLFQQCSVAKLPAGTVDTLLKPENVEKLKSVLHTM